MHKCKTIGCKNTINAEDQNDLGICQECMKFLDELFGTSHTKPTHKTPTDKKVGDKYDDGKFQYDLVMVDMARALYAVVDVATYGANKYTPGGWKYVDDAFRRYENAQFRHAAYRHFGEMYDSESKRLHLAHEAWNALAKLELFIRAELLHKEDKTA